jgi:hypothetical protein
MERFDGVEALIARIAADLEAIHGILAVAPEARP